MAIAVLALLGGCMPAHGGQWSPYLASTSSTATATDFQSEPRYSLDATARDELSGECSEATRWSAEVRDLLSDPEQTAYSTELAASDDLYQYSRALQTQITSLLTVFRISGDLAILDEVDRLAQLMREQLDDSWRDTADGSDGTSDGYLNWVWRGGHDDENRGKDLTVVDELRSHSLVAAFAAAFDANRELASPAGVDYGERADFWVDYLRNHFEAKWRERNSVSWPKFPFMGNPFMHQTVNFVRYHYYMHALTGEHSYLAEAHRLSNLALSEFSEVETEEGAVLAWPRALAANGGDHRYLMPSTYARYVYSDAVDLHLEGFYLWRNEELMDGLAGTLVQFMLETESLEVARDLGGGRALGGYDASPDHRDPLRPEIYALSPFALVMAWDRSGSIRGFSERVHETISDSQRAAHITAGFMLDLHLNGC